MTVPVHIPPHELAARLIGATLPFEGVGGIVVETEAYDFDDPASHSYGGATPRSAAMFGPAGNAYVYRIYGLHFCLNLVCGARPGGAVLFRALEPTHGLDIMRARRGDARIETLCAGPGRLSAALGVTSQQNGAPMLHPPFDLTLSTQAHRVIRGPRIGVTKAGETPWRFGLAGSRYLSRRFSAARSTERH